MRYLLFAALLLCGAAMLTAQTFRSGNPDQLWSLPSELEEISGLAFSPDGRWLLAVQDEWGTLYGLDPETGRVDTTWSIAEKGDFEGVAASDSAIWLLRSDGRLFHSRWQDGPSGEVKVIKTDFPKGTDLEGLAWEPQTRRLLVAAKDLPGEDPNAVKGWLMLDPVTGLRDPVLLGVDRKMLREAVRAQVTQSSKKRILRWLDSETDRFLLGPSGIAIHPEDQSICLISSRGKLLMIFEPDGTLRSVFPLDKQVLMQPEGVAFNPAGDLFIATEGKKGVPGKIAVYRNPFKIPARGEPVAE